MGGGLKAKIKVAKYILLVIFLAFLLPFLSPKNSLKL